MTRQPSERTRAEVLLEEMRDQIRVVLEGHSVLNARIDRLERRMEERFAVVETALLALSRDTRKQFEDMNHRFEQMNHRFTQIDRRFEAMEQRFNHQFEQVDGRLETIDHRLIVHEQLHQN